MINHLHIRSIFGQDTGNWNKSQSIYYQDLPSKVSSRLFHIYDTASKQLNIEKLVKYAGQK